MKAYALQRILDDMSRLGGMLGCAVVQGDSGMVIAFSGNDQWMSAAESAVDLVRLGARNRDLRQLGPARAVVSIHATCRVTVTPFLAGVALVCFSLEPDATDWAAWKRLTGFLSAEIRLM